MTTAYTSLLGLALPVTGELSGTWGDTVNNSITSLLDSAIAGTTTISSDADVTLTTTTGAANTSREAILLWTAGGTVTRTITAPAQSKVYVVINASSSTQSIKLVGVGPTTGVTIVQGESAVCAWNGSDFIKVSNISGAGSFTSLTYTTTLTGGTGIVNLGSGQFYKDASGNVGIGTSSPSTKFHVAGAAAIARIDRTADASANPELQLTAVARQFNVGVGGATFATAAIQGSYYLYDSTATAYRMVVDSSGNVGIGTTSPGAKLDVSGNILFSASNPLLRFNTGGPQLYVTTGNTLQFSVNGGTSEAMRIDSNGNVLVGTTTVSGSTGGITVATTTSGSVTTPIAMRNAGTANGTGVALSFRGLTNASAEADYAYLTMVADDTTAKTGSIRFSTVSGASPVERMRIDSSGNVEIGTTANNVYDQVGAPRPLVVQKSDTGTTLNGSTAAITIVNGDTTTSNTAQLNFAAITGASTNQYSSAVIACTFGARTNAQYPTGILTFSTSTTLNVAPTEKMRIDTSGNVGIGTSSPNNIRLSVDSGAANYSTSFIKGSGTLPDNNDNSVLYVNHAGTAGTGFRLRTDQALTGTNFAHILVNNASASINGLQVSQYGTGYIASFDKSGTVAMRIDNSGNVGIGTTGPSAPLEVNGTATAVRATSAQLWLSRTTAATQYQGICLRTGAASDAFIGRPPASDDIIFGFDTGTALSEKMRIDTSGNVLVGTTATASYMDGRIIALSTSVNPALTVKSIDATQFCSSMWVAATTGNNIFTNFLTETSPTVRGSISYNRAGGLVVYNTTSDYRAKTVNGLVQNALAKVALLKPSTGRMNGASLDIEFFVAHELQEVVPSAVTGEKDAINEDGSPAYQMVDKSAVIPLLTAAIQEQQALIASLTARIVALESN